MTKLFLTIFFSLISLTIYAQNKPFWVIISPDRFLVNHIDTIFTYNTDNRSITYNNGTIKLTQTDNKTTTIINYKIDSLRKDAINSVPVAVLKQHGRLAVIDNSNNKISIEGNFVNGKKVGIWHDWDEGFDNYSAYDTLGREIPLGKFYIDTTCQRIHLYKIDTIAFVYNEVKEIKLIVNPVAFFKTKKAEEGDTLQFCVLNCYMDSMGYKSYKETNNDFVRFIWFRPYHPINLNISKNDSEIRLNLRVTDAQYDFDFGNVVQSNSIIRNDTKEFEIISSELDNIDFWNQISIDNYYGDYLFVEARINGKYNCKRINCFEYRLEENKSIMKLFKKYAKLAGVKHDYRIEY